ncbi:O-antigen ligase family protein, partial [Patescibacteria group bacterium]|nr:O-antigen ligase family protein [Patescibacteria group bacterium]
MVGVFCVAALAQYFGGFFPGESKDFMGRLVWPFIDFVTLKSSSANWAAFFVTPAVVLFFIKAFSTRGRWPYPLLFLLTSVTLYLTQSYGGYAAVIAGITLYLFRAQPYKKFVISLLIISAVIGAGYLHQHTTWKYQVLTGESDYRYANSAASRGDIYRMDLSMILTNPLLGVGMNQYQNYFAAHQQEVLEHELNESHVPPHAHNFFLSFWTSLGFFGFLAMIILILGLFWRTKFDPGSPAVFVIVAIMVHGLIDSWYWKQDTAYIFWLMIMFAYLYRLPVRGKK